MFDKETVSVATLSHNVGKSDKTKDTRYCKYEVNGMAISFSQPKDNPLPPAFLKITTVKSSAVEFENLTK